jgi:diguanylate cyclase (GGDEF)-like protein
MKQTVLLADDDAAVTEVVATALAEAGYRCVIARDGQSALDLVRSERPDLVVLDLRMPVLSGDDVQRELRRDPLTRYVPVIIVTAREQAGDAVARLRAGADDFIAKPFDLDELVARVGTTLRRSAELRSLNPLSGLPGNVTIAREIEARLGDDGADACLYVDIDHFKQFNDRYGFARGDLLIGRLAELLAQATAGLDRFVGHIGGDDFVVVAPMKRAEALARDIVQQFDAMVPELYDAEDRARGYVEDTDRRGRARRVPFVRVSIGIVPLLADRFEDATDVARAAAEMKEVAKRSEGSQWAVDRRGSVASSRHAIAERL